MLVLCKCICMLIHMFVNEYKLCRKGVDAQIPRFDKSLEEFYSICDQIELQLVNIYMCKECTFLKLLFISENIH